MDTSTCPKCSGAMERGFVASRSLDYTKPDDWVAGTPEKSLVFGTQIRGKEHWQLLAFRCAGCGFIEFYASKP